MEEHLVAWLSITFAIIVQAVLVTAFLSRQIDRKLDFSLYDRKHEDLERRLEQKMETNVGNLNEAIQRRFGTVEERLRKIEIILAGHFPDIKP